YQKVIANSMTKAIEVQQKPSLIQPTEILLQLVPKLTKRIRIKVDTFTNQKSLSKSEQFSIPLVEYPMISFDTSGITTDLYMKQQSSN
ncbi:19610_t:CDS:1, partial [Gigaspora rosea]